MSEPETITVHLSPDAIDALNKALHERIMEAQQEASSDFVQSLTAIAHKELMVILMKARQIMDSNPTPRTNRRTQEDAE